LICMLWHATIGGGKLSELRQSNITCGGNFNDESLASRWKVENVNGKKEEEAA